MFAPIILLFLLLQSSCGPAREALMRVTPGVPDPSGCTPEAQRCNANVPEVCSASGRWWPALPRRPDGSQRACSERCLVDVDAGVAFCALGADGGL